VINLRREKPNSKGKKGNVGIRREKLNELHHPSNNDPEGIHEAMDKIQTARHIILTGLILDNISKYRCGFVGVFLYVTCNLLYFVIGVFYDPSNGRAYEEGGLLSAT